jgi:hypothetical protein
MAQLTRQWVDNDYDVNELFLGPTDIFSATNFDSIVDDPHFREMCEVFTFTCTTTCLNDFEETNRRMEKLEVFITQGREFEIFVVLDIPKYLAGDIVYLERFNRNLQLIDRSNVFFLLNVHQGDMFEGFNLDDLTTKLKADYGTKMRINPSYLRGTSKRHVEKYAHMHRDVMRDQINDKTIKTVFFNMIDKYFGGTTFNIYTYTNHQLHVTPLIYEAIPLLNDQTTISARDDGFFDLDTVNDKINELEIAQYEYSDETTECSTCKYLTSCVERNVLSYMEDRNILDCFLPKEMFRDASRVIELENRNVTG